MKSGKGKAFMLIVPVILLLVLVFLYKNTMENEEPKAPVTPTVSATLVPPTPEPTVTPAPTPTPTPIPVPVADQIGNSSGQKVSYQVYSGNTSITGYQGKESIVFGSGEAYRQAEGITTFRGDNYRSGPAYGTRKVVEKKLELVWSYDELKQIDPNWPGVGWTGQPLIIHWPENIRKIMNLKPEFKDKDFAEVIQVTLDGNIYFLDLDTGKPTRDPITIGLPIKGTPMLDPRGYPILYTGMGIRTVASGASGPWKYRIFSLIDQKEIFSIPGSDPNAFRTWGAFDSTGLLHAQTDTLFQCGENGMVYKVKLNTRFDVENGTLSLQPETIKFRYKNPFSSSQGIEASPVMYRDLMFLTDNGGMLQCLDINSLTPKWVFNLGDDTDSTPALEETPEGVFLYTGNEVDKQGSTGNATLRKMNALTGEQVWEQSYSCWKDDTINGGVFSAPAIGTGDIEDIVIFNIAKTGTEWGGRMVALDKLTGEEVWAKALQYYGWSSPTVFKSEDGTSYMIFCDSRGNMFLMDPKTGETLDTISLERNVEASPAIYNDMAVVGSYALKIFGVRIK